MKNIKKTENKLIPNSLFNKYMCKEKVITILYLNFLLVIFTNIIHWKKNKHYCQVHTNHKSYTYSLLRNCYIILILLIPYV
jgi:magnesium-transporting ATPase (P-type)